MLLLCVRLQAAEWRGAQEKALQDQADAEAVKTRFKEAERVSPLFSGQLSFEVPCALNCCYISNGQAVIRCCSVAGPVIAVHVSTECCSTIMKGLYAMSSKRGGCLDDMRRLHVSYLSMPSVRQDFNVSHDGTLLHNAGAQEGTGFSLQSVRGGQEDPG